MLSSVELGGSRRINGKAQVSVLRSGHSGAFCIFASPDGCCAVMLSLVTFGSSFLPAMLVVIMQLLTSINHFCNTVILNPMLSLACASTWPWPGQWESCMVGTRDALY